ncbi:unnamed protein product [Mytilus edulis]|uniref:Uncharacterized protein n=1 Tax=Mytilus edulis TaxID=6550 RepID=A0A8S3VB40_MYTED|nr:unnamed protein product [Mytilus edulis]
MYKKLGELKDHNDRKLAEFKAAIRYKQSEKHSGPHDQRKRYRDNSYNYDTMEIYKLPSVPSNDFNTNHNSYLPMGWALKETKARVTFIAQQKEFMVDKFNIGKVTGNKVDPYVAAEEMRMSGKFKRSEYLSGQQISSYFSRLFQQDKKTSSDDCVAALCEENKEHLKTTIKHILS